MIKAERLRTGYLNNPIGIDIKNPVLSWNISGAVGQTGYEIEYKINDSESCLIYDSESQSMRVRFPEKVESRDRVQWRIRLTDENGVQGVWSDWVYFEAGLMKPEDWTAKWIMGNYIHSPKKTVRYPVDCFQKKFSTDEPVLRARLYITACGLYEAYINGKKVGEDVFTPGSTAFQKRVHVQTYDVTELLDRSGENVLNIDLADGFYASKTGCFGKVKEYGFEPKVLAQLEIIYLSGKTKCIVTDENFDWSNDGPVTYADLKDGEDVDFRKSPSYGEKARLTSYSGIICSSNNVPVREKEIFKMPSVIHCPDGHTILDFRQNIAGYVEVSVAGKRGAKASLICGEKLDENGNFTMKNISMKGDYDTERLQRINFCFDGNRHVWHPSFTVMGFRYVLLLNWPDEIRPEDFRAIAVYSDMEITGKFECSDPGVRRIVENTLWSMKGNFLDVPTDCPTRERAGWTGDAQLFFNTGNYLMDQAAFFRKWIQDVADCQKENGMVYNINPSNPTSGNLAEWIIMEGSVGWGDAMIMIPYYYWKRYGDDSLIRKYWTNMCKCFSFYAKRIGKRNLFSLFSPKHGKYSRYLCACGRDFGEWTEPDDCAPSKIGLLTPHPEESTAYIAYDAGLMAEMASYLGKENSAEKYADLASKLREAYQYYFLKDGNFDTDRMCKYVRPCALHLTNEKLRKKLIAHIVDLNQKRNFRVGTGFLSTPFVAELLTEGGAADDALKMILNPEFGWMKQIHEGATTVWENWTDDASLNHYSKGACCQWFFDCICGIRLDGEENHFRIEPHLLNDIESISFSYLSVYGEVLSGWKREDGKVIFYIEIPCGCTADVTLPDGWKQRLETGSYTFELGK